MRTPHVASFGYHEVTDNPLSSGFQRAGAMPYKHSRFAFTQHLAHIATGPVQPRERVTSIDFTKPGRHLLLTFDDGGVSAMHSAEELTRRGWIGHYFIVTGRLGTRGFLSGADVKELAAMGHVVGSHSHTHPDIFREQTLGKMLTEWQVSSSLLTQLLGRPIDTAAVPGGHISRAVLTSASMFGFRVLFTCEPRLVPWQVGGCTMLGRYLLKTHTPLLRVRDLAHFEGWTSARAMRFVKEAVRHTVPGLYRAYVTARTREQPPVGAVALR